MVPNSSPHLFSFPPTPPKDATPDNLSNAVNGAHNGQAGHDFGATALAIAASSAAQDAQAVEAKTYMSASNGLGSWGTTLTTSSSSKPREGNSSLHHQSAHHAGSLPYQHAAHYGSAPVSGGEFAGGSAHAYGFTHHSPHTAPIFNSSKGQSSQTSSSSGKSRTKGRSSAGKQQTAATRLTNRTSVQAKLTHH